MQPLMYTEIADWFHLLTAPEDYAEEAEIYRNTIRRFALQAHTLLELGSGGGNNASHLKQHFSLTLVELSPEMIKLSQRLNPELEHIHVIRIGTKSPADPATTNNESRPAQYAVPLASVASASRLSVGLPL